MTCSTVTVAGTDWIPPSEAVTVYPHYLKMSHGPTEEALTDLAVIVLLVFNVQAKLGQHNLQGDET
jgi:hypothetical protein